MLNKNYLRFSLAIPVVLIVFTLTQANFWNHGYASSSRCKSNGQKFTNSRPSEYCKCTEQFGKYYEVKMCCRRAFYYNTNSQKCSRTPGGGFPITLHDSQTCPDNFTGLLNYQKHPEYYHVCGYGRSFVARCFTGYKFDSFENCCVPKRKPVSIRIWDKSGANVNVTVPKCKRPGTYPVENNKKLYYRCLQGTYPNLYQEVLKCKRKMEYNNIEKRCVPAKFNYDVKCFEEGCFPIPQNCEMYYVCKDLKNGYFSVKYNFCPIGKAFDEHKGACVKEDLSSCVRNNDNCVSTTEYSNINDVDDSDSNNSETTINSDSESDSETTEQHVESDSESSDTTTITINDSDSESDSETAEQPDESDSESSEKTEPTTTKTINDSDSDSESDSETVEQPDEYDSESSEITTTDIIKINHDSDSDSESDSETAEQFYEETTISVRTENPATTTSEVTSETEESTLSDEDIITETEIQITSITEIPSTTTSEDIVETTVAKESTDENFGSTIEGEETSELTTTGVINTETITTGTGTKIQITDMTEPNTTIKITTEISAVTTTASEVTSEYSETETECSESTTPSEVTENTTETIVINTETIEFTSTAITEVPTIEISNSDIAIKITTDQISNTETSSTTCEVTATETPVTQISTQIVHVTTSTVNTVDSENSSTKLSEPITTSTTEIHIQEIETEVPITTIIGHVYVTKDSGLDTSTEFYTDEDDIQTETVGSTVSDGENETETPYTT